MRFRWLWMIFHVDPSEDAEKFVALPPDEVNDHLAEILERLQEAERKHSAFGIGACNNTR